MGRARSDVRTGDLHWVLPGERVRIGWAEHRVRDRRDRLPELHGDGGHLRERGLRRAAVRGPGTCDGCCSATGNCAGGASASACGVGGCEVCSDCTSIGDVCSAGACVATPPMCSPANCPFGCCDTSGVCQDGFLSDQCGSGGIACLNCTASGTTCDVNATPRACTKRADDVPGVLRRLPQRGRRRRPRSRSLGGACTAQDLAGGAGPHAPARGGYDGLLGLPLRHSRATGPRHARCAFSRSSSPSRR